MSLTPHRVPKSSKPDRQFSTIRRGGARLLLPRIAGAPPAGLALASGLAGLALLAAPARAQQKVRIGQIVNSLGKQDTITTPLATPAELAGTWIMTHWDADTGTGATLKPYEWIFTLQADGTASQRHRDRGVEVEDTMVVFPTTRAATPWVMRTRRWGVAGDSLVFVADSGFVRDRGRFTRDGDRLLWGRLPDFSCADTLHRVNASPTLPPPPTIPPGAVTVDRAALIGTWVGVSLGVPGDTTVKLWDITTDTLTLAADGTSTYSSAAIGRRETTTTQWKLYPGNILVDARGTYVIQALKDGVLTLTISHANPCHQAWVYKRVGP